jgi:hypothetical protein
MVYEHPIGQPFSDHELAPWSSKWFNNYWSCSEQSSHSKANFLQVEHCDLVFSVITQRVVSSTSPADWTHFLRSASLLGPPLCHSFMKHKMLLCFIREKCEILTTAAFLWLQLVTSLCNFKCAALRI